jgi:predicted  nucleic acid-binding Zn-ribbon protein
MAKAKFDIRTEATRPLYASVGAADRAVEAVRGSVADVQKRFEDVQQSVRAIDLEPQALRARATTLVNARVDALTKQAQDRRDRIEARVAELQTRALALPEQVQTLLEQSEATYGELVTRGEDLVARIRRQESTKAAVSSAKSTKARAKTTRTQAGKAAKSTADSATSTARKAAKSTAATARSQSTRPRSSAKATATTARKTATSTVEAATDAAKKVGD